MSTSIAFKLKISITATYRNTGQDLESPVIPFTYDILETLIDGAGSGKAQALWSDTITASDAGTTIDVFGGITDGHGNALSLDQIKFLLIVNKSIVTGEYIDVFGSAQHLTWMTGATDERRIYPGGFDMMYAPGAAADSPTAGAGSADEILITAASGKTPAVDIVLIGENN